MQHFRVIRLQRQELFLIVRHEDAALGAQILDDLVRQKLRQCRDADVLDLPILLFVLDALGDKIAKRRVGGGQIRLRDGRFFRAGDNLFLLAEIDQRALGTLQANLQLLELILEKGLGVGVGLKALVEIGGDESVRKTHRDRLRANGKMVGVGDIDQARTRDGADDAIGHDDACHATLDRRPGDLGLRRRAAKKSDDPREQGRRDAPRELRIIREVQGGNGPLRDAAALQQLILRAQKFEIAVLGRGHFAALHDFRAAAVDLEAHGRCVQASGHQRTRAADGDGGDDNAQNDPLEAPDDAQIFVECLEKTLGRRRRRATRGEMGGLGVQARDFQRIGRHAHGRGGHTLAKNLIFAAAHGSFLAFIIDNLPQTLQPPEARATRAGLHPADGKRSSASPNRRL